MNRITKSSLILAASLAATSMASADLMVYEFGARTAQTLDSLGTKFVVGCVVLALGMVAAAALCKKK